MRCNTIVRQRRLVIYMNILFTKRKDFLSAVCLSLVMLCRFKSLDYIDAIVDNSKDLCVFSELQYHDFYMNLACFCQQGNMLIG